MTERLVRGYALVGTLAYLNTTLAKEKPAVLAQLSPDVRSAVDGYREVQWYPIHHWCELLRGIAATANGDEAAAIELLSKTGQSIGTLAMSTFLRLLLKIMTPSLFSTKLPSIWERDNNSGRIVRESFDAEKRRWVYRLEDVEGYDYLGPVGKGYTVLAMKQMGKEAKVTMTGWSLKTPGPKEIVYTVEW